MDNKINERIRFIDMEIKDIDKELINLITKNVDHSAEIKKLNDKRSALTDECNKLRKQDV